MIGAQPTIGLHMYHLSPLTVRNEIAEKASNFPLFIRNTDKLQLSRVLFPVPFMKIPGNVFRVWVRFETLDIGFLGH